MNSMKSPQLLHGKRISAFLMVGVILAFVGLTSCSKVQIVKHTQIIGVENQGERTDMNATTGTGESTATTGSEGTNGFTEGATTITSTTTTSTSTSTTSPSAEVSAPFPPLNILDNVNNPNLGRQMELSVFPQSMDVVRETPSGQKERMVYFSVQIPDRKGMTGVTLQVQTPAGLVTRELIDIDQSIFERYDTVWIQEPLSDSYPARMYDKYGYVLWDGTLDVKPAEKTTVIPFSAIETPSKLGNLTLRGINYYPRENPWMGTWVSTSEQRFNEEMQEIHTKLNANAVRTFYMPNYPELHYIGMNFTPATIEKMNGLLRAVDNNDMKMLMCLMGGSMDLEDLNDSARYIRTGVEPFIYDGRVLMWDLINEPGGADGPQKPPYRTFVPAMYKWLTTVDTNHESQVGLTWQFDQLISLGVNPPIGQYHDYGWAIGIPGDNTHQNLTQYLDKTRNVGEGILDINEQIHTPVIIGEFGANAIGEHEDGKDHEGNYVTYEYQEAVYYGVISGAEWASENGGRITGIFPWCAFDFINAGIDEKYFGVIKTDGSLTPTGEYLLETYNKWAKEHPAPWDKK